ncbi:hypothetical protein GCM10025860_00670 [Methanobacterium ferruginis]|nr:hypothetical protein GCM10025860_00670 [Methanobacterium ferruginis]
MIEIRFHGRGGQGAVTAAEILAKAAFEDGKYCQAFPFLVLSGRVHQLWLLPESMINQ